MGDSVWWGLLGVFAGGALPWLEAVVVIPGGIIAGLPVVPVLIAGVVGNLLTVGLAAFAGDWGRERIAARRRRRAARRDAQAEPHVAHRRAARRRRRRDRIEHIMDRGGLPLLALLGPLGLGTQVSALVAVATGVGPARTFAWIGGATVFWSLVAAGITIAGFEAFR
ncbi:MAG: hypothetical protein Q8Q02_10685 [Nocardioides sp.]|nr:hypothetical protein [Nocardioides sp.]